MWANKLRDIKGVIWELCLKTQRASLDGCISVCPSICLSSVCLYVGPSIWMSVCVLISRCMSVCPDICVSWCLDVCLSGCISIWISVCLDVYFNVCLNVWMYHWMPWCLYVCLCVWLYVCLSGYVCFYFCLSRCLDVPWAGFLSFSLSGYMSWCQDVLCLVVWMNVSLYRCPSI